MGFEQILRKTVLVAEDDQSIADLLLFWLEKENYQTFRALDGHQALDLSLRHTPDLLIIDLQMPFMDGGTAAQEIRRHDSLREKPIVFMTAHGDKGIELFVNIEMLGDGPIEYITKPLDFVYLGELLRRLL